MIRERKTEICVDYFVNKLTIRELQLKYGRFPRPKKSIFEWSKNQFISDVILDRIKEAVKEEKKRGSLYGKQEAYHKDEMEYEGAPMFNYQILHNE